MKRYISLCMAIGFLMALAATAMAGTTPGSGIEGTFHDLSSNGAGIGPTLGTTDNRICVYCHTPHFAAKKSDFTGANANINYYPLWNHDLTFATFQTYTNGTDIPSNIPSQLNAIQTGPGGVSRLCLSCHDGSVAINSYGNFQGNPDHNTGAIMMPAGYQIGAGGDLSNHHPIGFDYASVYALDDEIAPVTRPLNGSSTGLTINDLLWGGKVECSSCHDVHNTKNEGPKFLWVDDTHQSDLCRSCHLK